MDTDILPPRYRGARQIGRGGMGEIYRATDSVLGRAVAIKILAERYANDEAIRERFTREALAAARLSGDPHTVTIFDVGEHNDRPYLVMEYLGGGSLGDLLRDEGPQPLQRVLTWLEQAAWALDAAHAEGVVHRDVKPGNLLLDRDGVVHVADFGVASAVGLDSLTITGTVLGTAGYLSPEQAQGDRATAASDRYALAIVAFELLTGKRPFAADSPTAEAAAHVNAEVPSICEIQNELPCELDPVFEKALAKDPAQRYASCVEFVAALRAAFADAAGTTRELRTIPAPVTAPTRPVGGEVERAAWATPSAPAVLRPVRAPRRPWLALLALVLLGAIGGALAAYFLTRGHAQNVAAPQPKVKTIVRTVTNSSGVTTTVRQQVTTAPPAPVPAGNSPHALNDQGYAKMRVGDYSGALPLLEQAVRQLKGVGPSDPYEAYANYNLGYSLLQLGQCKQAIKYLKRAERLEPQRPEPGQAIARAEACK